MPARNSGRVPVRLLLFNSLWKKKKIQVTRRMKSERGTGQLQLSQRCEHPYFRGNGSTQAVMMQYPVAKKALELIATETPTKDNKKQIHPHVLESLEPPKLGRNGSAQAVPIQPTAGRRSQQAILTQKDDKMQIHPHVHQRCEHPNLNGNGSTQAVRRQLSAAKEAHGVNYHRNTPKRWPEAKIHSQFGQRREHPNLGGNGSTQAVPIQPTGARRSQQIKLPQKDDKKQNSLTETAKMGASQSGWEWFLSSCSLPYIYSTEREKM